MPIDVVVDACFADAVHMICCVDLTTKNVDSFNNGVDFIRIRSTSVRT